MGNKKLRVNINGNIKYMTITDKVIRYYAIAVTVLAAILLATQCAGDDETIVVAEKSGTFAPITNPTPLPAPPPIVKYIKGQTITVPAKMNQELYEFYMESVNRELAAKDTIAQLRETVKQAELYAKAIETNTYQNKFENGKISITIDSETQGTLLSIKPTWTIKADSIKRKSLRSVYLGGEIGTNKAAKANIMYQSGRFIYSGSYDADKTIWAGVNIRAFGF